MQAKVGAVQAVEAAELKVQHSSQELVAPQDVTTVGLAVHVATMQVQNAAAKKRDTKTTPRSTTK